MFDTEKYDWYVGDSEPWFEGMYDDDGYLVYFIPCHALIGTNTEYTSGVDCYTKRH